MPMVANDGPHYGDNVKLAGPGKYTLKLSDRAARRVGACPLRPAHRQGDRRRPVVQAVHASSTSSPTPASARRAATEMTTLRPVHRSAASTRGSIASSPLRRDLRALAYVRPGRGRAPGRQALRARRQIRAADDRSPRRKALQDRDQQRRQGPDGIREQGPEAGEGARRRREVVGRHQRAEARHLHLLRRVSHGRARRARSSRSDPRRTAHFAMGNALFIIWRESAEAMLVVGILYAWLAKQPDVEARDALPVGRRRAPASASRSRWPP